MSKGVEYMNTLLKVCSCVLVLTIGIAATSQTTVETSKSPLRPGVSVVMPKTRNATAIPGADREDALVVTIMRNGVIFIGTDRVDPSAFPKKLNGRRDFYLKADARTHYADVLGAIRTASKGRAETLTLLTSQKDLEMSGPLAPPMGIPVSVVPSISVTAGTVLLQLLNSNQSGPDLTINNKRLPLTGLKDSLEKHFENNPRRAVTVEASGQLPFADVVNVIDICSPMQATVTLGTRQF
jgi:biopolymer transport protein ExbD